MTILQTRYRVDGMDCAGCAMKIDKVVRRLEGVEDVVLSVTAGTMSVQHDDHTDLDALAARVTSLGYQVAPLTSTPPASPRCGCCHDHDHDHDAHDHGAHDHGPGHDHQPAHAHHHDAAAGHSHHHHASEDGPLWQSAKARLALASGVAFVVAWILAWLLPAYAIPFYTAAVIVGLYPIARNAFMAARAGSPFTIETLMSIAAIGAVLIGAAEEAAMVVFLFLIGELLEGIAAGKARAGIKALTALVPKSALLVVGDTTREVPADTLAIGAVILVRPGDRIAADGVILAGHGGIDESPVTGESTPVAKSVGAQVFAGTVNGDSALTLRVTATAADNTIARVIRLVEEAQESKAPTERFIDRFARYYTPGVLVAGALVALVPPLLFGGALGEWIYKGLAVLLIGCPCALVISTPAAIAASLSSGARKGLLIKGGATLENAGKITAVAFDKTGTLTAGKPVVTDILAFSTSEADVLARAAALETGSSHPLAQAVLTRATAAAVTPPRAESIRVIGGKGVVGNVDGSELRLGSASDPGHLVSLSDTERADIDALHHAGKTVSVLLVGDQAVGALAFSDEPRPDAAAALATLSGMGIRTIMLTGDNARAARSIGERLKVEVRAELLPEDKRRIVDELKATGQFVAKIGDGINDAPALAAADIGVAMGGGTDVALETADAAVLNGRVGDVVELIRLSRRTMANIGQNIAIALGLKGMLLVTTLIGITGLWPAVLADTGATVLVTANALRLLGHAPRA